MRGWGRLADPFWLGEWAGLGPREDKMPCCLLAAALAAGDRALDLQLRSGWGLGRRQCPRAACLCAGCSALHLQVNAGGHLGLRTLSQDEARHNPGLEHWFPPRRHWLC